MSDLKNVHPLSLKKLKDGPFVSLDEGIVRARRLVSGKTGIISKVEFDELSPDDPDVFFARTTPANVETLCGQEALNHGDAVSVDSRRAVLKSVGESVERYCSAQYEKELFLYSSYNDLKSEAITPESFALFSKEQYSKSTFRYKPLTASKKLHWVQGYSIVNERPVYVPASFVYVPYDFIALNETPTHDPISTGLACHTSFTNAIYKSILEAIERDCYMINWQNRINASHFDPREIDDSLVQSLLSAMDRLPVKLYAHYLTLDIDVHVIQVMLKTQDNHLPYTVMGIGTDLSFANALAQALEEVFLTFLGMRRYVQIRSDFKPQANYKNVTSPMLHALAYSMWPEVEPGIEFLTNSPNEMSGKNLPIIKSESMLKNIETLVDRIKKNDLDVILFDLTTSDIDEAGYKVIRAVIPGLQPLDTNHNYRHLGGERLYNVPVKLGLRETPLNPNELTPYPHMFP
jgi:ribosomal protein S12 methylthiotransferase accessory factor